MLFEGVIPEGNYGAGTVIVWDTGKYTTESDLSELFDKGKIGFTLYGQKLRGRFYLVRTSTENQWLLLKKSDQFDSKEDLTISRPESVLTGRSNDQLATGRKQKNKSHNIKALVRQIFCPHVQRMFLQSLSFLYLLLMQHHLDI